MAEEPAGYVTCYVLDGSGKLVLPSFPFVYRTLEEADFECCRLPQRPGWRPIVMALHDVASKSKHPC